MAAVIHKTTLEYRPSVNTPDFPTETWLHNPDMSAVIGVLQRYWKIAGSAVIEMTVPEKSAVDAALASAALASAKSVADTAIDGLGGYNLRALAKLIVDQLNLLRNDVVGTTTFAFDPANLADAAGLTKADITVIGAAFGDMVDVAAPYTLSGMTVTAYVHAANTVGIRLQNESGGALNLANGNWTVIVRRPTVLAQLTLAQAKNAYKNLIAGSDLDE
jgi:hypothetical protein